MELVVLRYNLSNDSTNGMLMLKTSTGYDFMCYTLEDEYRAVKVTNGMLMLKPQQATTLCVTL